MASDLLLLAEFRAFLPEFSDTAIYPDSIVNQRLIEAGTIINIQFLGDRTSFAHGYLIGHLLKKFGPVNALATPPGAQEVASASAGSSSASFVTSVPGDGELGSTVYGRHYLTLVRSVPHKYIAI